MRYAYTGVSKSSHPPTSSKPTLVDHIHLLHVGVELGTTVCATSHLTLHHTLQSREERDGPTPSGLAVRLPLIEDGGREQTDAMVGQNGDGKEDLSRRGGGV